MTYWISSSAICLHIQWTQLQQIFHADIRLLVQSISSKFSYENREINSIKIIYQVLLISDGDFQILTTTSNVYRQAALNAKFMFAERMSKTMTCNEISSVISYCMVERVMYNEIYRYCDNM